MIRALFSIIIFVLLFGVPPSILAIFDPLGVPNNRYGIHVADPNDIIDTAHLVNSSGGDWGYVTFVIPETDRNSEKWQKIFDQMRRLHLIPLVRLATKPNGDMWEKPTEKSTEDWIPFLTNLNWPVANRYIILFNEPNHANEWGQSIDPEGYADISIDLAKKLKAASDDFFILPAGLDASANNGGNTMDEALFLDRIQKSKPDFFTIIDGWTSHSYPNPGFSGSPYAAGRGTLQTFDWELQYLQQFGLTKKLPVFITETGWVHDQGTAMHSASSPSQVGQHMLAASESVWKDERIVAITPFVFSYQGAPFINFSWKLPGAGDYYPHYYDYQSIPKIPGQPKQHERYALNPKLIPSTLISDSVYTLKTHIKNEGQGIVNTKNGYTLSLDGKDSSNFTMTADPLPTLEPGQEAEITIRLHTPLRTGSYNLQIVLKHHEQSVVLEKQKLSLVPPPSLSFKVQLGWRSYNNAKNVTVLIYHDALLIHKFSGLTVINGNGTVTGLSDVIPGIRYRIVILVDYYLPRQAIQTLNKKVTNIAFRRFLPLDFNRDGKFSLSDIAALLKSKPNVILPLFIGP